MKKQYGAFLLTWLILSITFASYGIIINVVAGLFLPQLIPTFHPWMYYVSALGSVLYVLSLIFIMLWKKWAVYSAMLLALAVVIFNFAIGVSVFFSVIGLVGPGVLLWAVLRKWQLFE